MSRETVKSFFMTASDNAELQEKLQADNSPANIVKIAAEEGYEFTEKDLQAVLDKWNRGDQAELAEEELEAVAGGMTAEPRMRSQGTTSAGVTTCCW